MARKTRSELKNYFVRGAIPKQEDFQDFIDSSINILDDSLYKDAGKSLILSEEGREKEYLRLNKGSWQNRRPSWVIRGENSQKTAGLNIEQSMNSNLEEEDQRISRLFISESGQVGIGTEEPKHLLDVGGVVGMQGRKGYFAHGEVPADGKWHPIVSGLTGVQAFELVAATNAEKGFGAHAITMATAVSAYGKSKSRIHKIRGRFGRCSNRIDIRWNGSYFNFGLEIRTKRNYKGDVKVLYNVAKLW